MDTILGLFSGLWGKLAAVLGVVIGIVTMFFQVKKAGKDEVIAESKDKEIQNVQKANKIEHDVAISKPDAKRNELLNDWTRD